MSGSERESRGPDPIARWLGDDSPPPRRAGSSVYRAAGLFLAESLEVLSPLGAFEYDGRYARHYEVTDVEDTEAPDVPRDEPFRTSLVTGSSSWSYSPNCYCSSCEAHRRLRNPTSAGYRDEWARAVADYATVAHPTFRPPPRLREYVETRLVSSSPTLFDRDDVQSVVTTLRTLGEASVRVSAQFTVAFSEALQRVTLGFDPAFTPLTPTAERDDLDRWVDDGGACGLVDY